MSSETKRWGRRPFWGLSFDYDPQWFLTEEQKEIQRRLIDLCRTSLRPNALVSDQHYEFPYKNMEALASQGLLGLIIPKEHGGLGQNHVCMAMVVETIARYGCPSTAMVCVMHYIAVSALLFRHHSNARVQDLLRRVNEEALIGTVSYSDPATGGHFWYPMSSRTQMTADGRIKLLKCGSWATSAGFADFYVIITTSPQFDGNFSNLSCFLLFKDDVRANTEDWSSLGMHGNHSGPLVCESTITEDQLIGPYERYEDMIDHRSYAHNLSGCEIMNGIRANDLCDTGAIRPSGSRGDGMASLNEVGSPRFLLLVSACWNGIAIGAIDIARRHVITKEHADIGMRIADYPTIQDYFGEAVCGTNACRMMVFTVAQLMDQVTDNNDWNVYKDWNAPLRREKMLLNPGTDDMIGSLHPCWCWQMRFECAKNVNKATDKMMQACGGSGYKRDLGVERLLRDGRAGWLMGPSNEVLKQFVGKSSLFGLESLDLWSQSSDRRALNVELLKLGDDEKMEIAQRLVREVTMNAPLEKSEKNSYQDTEFDNPFNTEPPATRGSFTDSNGIEHLPALSPDCFVPLKLLSIRPLGDKQAEFQFALPQASQHTGCLPGQYVQVRVKVGDGDKYCQRYFSPVSATNDYGRIDLVMKFESHGQLSKRFRALNPGDLVEFRGPCGGFEYESTSIKHLSLVASGSGATPCVQLVRDIMADPDDQTSIFMLYHADKESDLIFKSELDDYDTRDCRFQVYYSVSEGAEKENWQGAEGHIDKDMISDHLAGVQALDHKILLCGGPTMIVSVMRSLSLMGYSSEQIFVYGQFGAEQVRAVYGRNAKLSSHRL